MNLGRVSNDPLRDGFAIYGYGLYFTDSRILGVSYRKITLQAYRPAFVLFLVFIVSLVFVIVYAKLSNITSDQPIPYAVISPVTAVLSLAYLLYLSPKQATKRIESEEPNSTLQLASQPTDLVLQRENISQIIVGRRRIDILMKTGEWYFFSTYSDSGTSYRASYWQQRLGKLLSLFQEFCSQSPPIGMFDKNKNQWRVAPRS